MKNSIIKIMILFIVCCIFLTGCIKWSDVEDAVGLRSVSEGTSCTYHYVNEKFNDIEEVQFYLNNDGLFVSFNNSTKHFVVGPDSKKIIEHFVFEKNEYIISKSFLEYYFNSYKAINRCPRTIYIDGRKNEFSITPNSAVGDPIKHVAYTIDAIVIQNTDGSSSTCHNTEAFVCDNKKWDDDKLLGDIWFEWGYTNNGSKYFWIAKDIGFSSFESMKENALTHAWQAFADNGWTIYEIPKKSVDDIWQKNNKIISKGKLGASGDPNTENTIIYIYSKDNPIYSGNVLTGDEQTIDGQSINNYYNDVGYIMPIIPDHNCTSLLGSPTQGQPNPSPAYLLTFAFKIIRYIALVIMVIMSIMDFIESVSSQDKDSINKAINKTLKRAILCVIIFLLPSIIEFVLTFLNNKAINICINT